MRYELAKVKHSPSLSQETPAFTADILRDGVKVGTVSNHGTGGPNDCHMSREEDAILSAHIATLPPWTCEGHSYPMSVDMFIGDLFGDWASLRDMRRRMKTDVVWTNGGKMFASRLGKANMTDRSVSSCCLQIVAKHPNAIILQHLSDAELLAAIKAVEA